MGGGVERGGEVGAAVVEGGGRDVLFEGKCPTVRRAGAVARAVFLQEGVVRAVADDEVF